MTRWGEGRACHLSRKNLAIIWIWIWTRKHFGSFWELLRKQVSVFGIFQNHIIFYFQIICLVGFRHVICAEKHSRVLLLFKSAEKDSVPLRWVKNYPLFFDIFFDFFSTFFFDFFCQKSENQEIRRREENQEPFLAKVEISKRIIEGSFLLKMA